MKRRALSLGIILFTTVLGACQSPPEENLRVVPQIEPSRPRRLAFSPVDGNRLLVMEANGLVEIWGISTPGKPELFSTMPARAIDASFSPDGRFVATACLDGRIRYWAVDGTLQWVSQGGHSQRARTVVVTPTEIISGGEDGTIRLWRLDGTPFGEPLALTKDEGSVVSLAVSPRGDIAALWANDSVHLWKRAAAAGGGAPAFEHTLLHKPEQPRDIAQFVRWARLDPTWGWDESVAFLPGGDGVVAVLFDSSLRSWGLDGTPKIVVPDPHKKRTVRALAMSAQGDAFATGGFDGIVHWWNLDGSPRGRGLQASEDIVLAVAISPHGERFATTGRDDRLCIWNRDGTLAFVFPRAGVGHHIVGVALAPQGTVLAAADDGGGVRLWNFDATPHGAPLSSGGETAGALAFSLDGRLAVASNRTIRVWDDNGAARGEPMDVGGNISALRFSPKGDALAVGTEQFQLWKDGRPLWAQTIRPSDYIQRIAFSPDGQMIVSGSWLGEIEVWNPDGSTRAKRAKQGREMTRGVAVAPDGDFIAAAIGGGFTVVYLFNLDLTPRGEPLEGQASPALGGVTTDDSVAGLAFSPGGTLVTGGAAGVVREWTLPSRQASTMEIGRGINQLGFWRKAFWVRVADDPIFLQDAPDEGGMLLFYNAKNALVATVLLRPQAALAFTPDGWFADTGWPSGSLRMYRPSGQALTDAELARRRSPERVLKALNAAAGG